MIIYGWNHLALIYRVGSWQYLATGYCNTAGELCMVMAWFLSCLCCIQIWHWLSNLGILLSYKGYVSSVCVITMALNDMKLYHMISLMTYRDQVMCPHPLGNSNLPSCVFQKRCSQKVPYAIVRHEISMICTESWFCPLPLTASKLHWTVNNNLEMISWEPSSDNIVGNVSCS